MKENHTRKYPVRISFEEIMLTPFEDILYWAKSALWEKIGVSKSFKFLGFDSFEFGDVNVETVFINKWVLKKMDQNKIIGILAEQVFPFISDIEIVKADFKLNILYDSLEGVYLWN